MKKSIFLILYLTISLISLSHQTANAQDLKIKLLKEIKQSKTLKLDWVWQMKSTDKYLFVSVHRDGDIIWFDRNRKTGELKQIATIDLNKDLGSKTHCDPYMIFGPKHTLYVSGQWTHSKGNQSSLGLSWYKLDKKKSEAKKLGKIALSGGKLYQSKNPHLLYLSAWYNGEIQEISLDPVTGTPTVTKKIKADGLGQFFCSSPNKKFAYSIGRHKIGLLSVGKDASLEYINATEIPNPPARGSYKTIAISPDGKHLYLFYSQSYKKKAGLWVYDRNVKTGEIIFNQIQHIPQLLGTNHIVFLSEGNTALFSGSPESPSRGLGWFNRDPITGKITYGGKASGSVPTTNDFAFDSKSGFIYSPGFWSSKSFKIYQLDMGNK